MPVYLCCLVTFKFLGGREHSFFICFVDYFGVQEVCEHLKSCWCLISTRGSPLLPDVKACIVEQQGIPQGYASASAISLQFQSGAHEPPAKRRSGYPMCFANPPWFTPQTCSCPCVGIVELFFSTRNRGASVASWGGMGSHESPGRFAYVHPGDRKRSDSSAPQRAKSSAYLVMMPEFLWSLCEKALWMQLTSVDVWVQLATTMAQGPRSWGIPVEIIVFSALASQHPQNKQSKYHHH